MLGPMRRGRRLRVGLALGALVLVVAGCARVVTFPNTTPGAPVAIQATLRRPPGDGPFSAVVLLHGCHGVSDQLDRWARWLADRAYVALVVDSFGSRGVPGDCLPEVDPSMPNTARLDDAFGALRYLQQQPFVAADRVGVMGWSQGGVFAMASVNGPSLERARQRGVAIPAPGFAAAAGIYPGGCPSLAHELVVRPLLILIGDADDWTPARLCQEMGALMRERGAEVTIIVYPGAHHYFDVEGQRLEFLPSVESLHRPGGGATVGYDAHAAADAYRQVEAFFGAHLRSRPR